MADQNKNQKSKIKYSNLSLDEVKHVAKLANLPLTDTELVKFQDQLSRILEYINQLQEVDTSGVEETSQVTGLENVFREDEVGACITQKQALSNAKNTHQGYIKVPHVFD